MNNKMHLKKTCSICASDLHFATIIFPFAQKEIEENVTIITMLETDEINKIVEIHKYNKKIEGKDYTNGNLNTDV